MTNGDKMKFSPVHLPNSRLKVYFKIGSKEKCAGFGRALSLARLKPHIKSIWNCDEGCTQGRKAVELCTEDGGIHNEVVGGDSQGHSADLREVNAKAKYPCFAIKRRHNFAFGMNKPETRHSLWRESIFFTFENHFIITNFRSFIFEYFFWPLTISVNPYTQLLDIVSMKLFQ